MDVRKSTSRQPFPSVMNPPSLGVQSPALIFVAVVQLLHREYNPAYFGCAKGLARFGFAGNFALFAAAPEGFTIRFAEPSRGWMNVVAVPCRG